MSTSGPGAVDGAPVGAPLGTQHPVGDGRMLLHQFGVPGTPVVWLAGGGVFGLYYWNLHELVAGFTTSVIYDRLGSGWSDPVELPRPGRRMTEDLHELLEVAGVATPVVLVGHSLGGLYARHFAKCFPDQVAGLVLLDPTHEDIADYLPDHAARQMAAWTSDTVLTPQQLETMRSTYRRVFDRALPDWPHAIRDPLLEQAFDPAVHARSVREPMDLLDLFAEVRADGPDPDLPMVVLAAMGSDAFTDELLTPQLKASAQESAQGKYRCYRDHIDTLPRAELRRLDDAGHIGMTWTHPDAIVQAIHDVLPH